MNDAAHTMITQKTPARIDLYHLFRRFSLINLAYPIVLDVLKVWAEAIGWLVRTTVCKESSIDISGAANVVASASTPKQPAQPIVSLKSYAQQVKSSFSVAPISGAPRHSRRPYRSAMFLSAVSVSSSGKRSSAPSARERSAPTASSLCSSLIRSGNSGTRQRLFLILITSNGSNTPVSRFHWDAPISANFAAPICPGNTH